MRNSHFARFIGTGSLILLFLSCLFQGCTKIPLLPVSSEEAPYFADDLDVASLKKSVTRSLQYLSHRDRKTEFKISSKSYSIGHLKHSLEAFLDLLNRNLPPEAFNTAIKQQFDIFQASGTSGLNFSRKMLVTGYYQPIFKGSLVKKSPFLHPLYSTPSDLVEKIGQRGDKSRIGRFEGNRFIPYWTRKEIENLHKASGHEIVWLRDPFDAFIIHIQGSALIQLEDGSIRGIHYARSNGRPYRSIGKFLVDTNRLSLDEAGMDAIRSYLQTHPEEKDTILQHNDSFIFFDWTRTLGAIGSIGKELTDGRSIAADQSCFPAGGIGFLLSRKPVVKNNRIIGWQPLHRFVTIQDKGSAIRGPGRIDLFFGKGDPAGMAAGRMKEEGKFYLLLLKQSNRTS